MLSVNQAQYRVLVDFFNHLYNVNHHSAESNFAYWADKLDLEGVSWSIQNTVAAIAAGRESNNLYLRSHLMQRDITVTHDTAKKGLIH